MSQTIVITGTSRGLGLEFTGQYLAGGDRVFALARAPEASAGLSALQAEYRTALTCITCDVTDSNSVTAAVVEIEGGATAIDLLIHNAGVSGDTGAAFGELDPADLRRVFEVNLVAPLGLTETCMHLLRRGSSPRVVFLTSRMGSIADNDGGGWWSYRISKAALNMACKNLALALRGTGVVTMVLHPGWVRTDMGGAAAPLSPTQSVEGLRRVIANLDAAGSGEFRDYSGAELPW